MPMRSLSPARLLCALAVAGLFAVAVAETAQARNRTELAGKLKRESRRLGADTGAYVVDLTSGRVLYSRKATTKLAPASNEKLFTTAAALRRFGADGTLSTTARLAEDAAVSAAGTLAGDLYLVGGGDPSLNDVALQGLAGAIVKQTGVKSVTGGVVGDDSFFDSRRGSYDSGYRPDSDLGGQLAGLTWGHGRATPGGPATVAAARLGFFLQKLGVKVRRTARAGRVAEAPGGPGAVVGTLLSPPMLTLAAITNQPSDNFYAETLVKDLGATFGTAGSTSAGLTVVRAELRELNVRPTLRDGSGLSRSDRASPEQIVTLLRGMYESDLNDGWMDSLAVAGRVGTLSRRMRGTAAAGRCRGKTGTLRNVSALSGYCRTKTGRTLAFSFLENHMNAGSAKAVEDRMVPALVSYRP